MQKHIEIMNALRGFEVRIIGPHGTLQTFSYPTVESARMCAEAKARTIGNCRIDDRTGM
jgi:hypothetical protein